MDIIENAIKYLGYPCVYYDGPQSGRSVEGFTCSGFVQYVLNLCGYLTPNWHANQFFDLFGVFIHEEFKRSGDLVFSTKKGIAPTHVGFYVSKGSLIRLLKEEKADNNYVPEQIQNIEHFILHARANEKRKVRIEELKRRSINSNSDRQIYYRNPIGFKRPAIKTEDLRYNYFL